MRHFDDKESNLIEILNEMILIAITIFLLIIDKGNKWTDNTIDWFMYIIIFNSLFVLLIIIGKLYIIRLKNKSFQEPIKLSIASKIISCIK